MLWGVDIRRATDQHVRLGQLKDLRLAAYFKGNREWHHDTIGKQRPVKSGHVFRRVSQLQSHARSRDVFGAGGQISANLIRGAGDPTIGEAACSGRDGRVI
jgi:hypothetical protein